MSVKGESHEQFFSLEEPSLAESLWTWKEVSKFLRVSRSWVYHHAEAGTLPCVRIGGYLLRFEPEEIRAFAAQWKATQVRPLVLRRTG